MTDPVGGPIEVVGPPVAAVSLPAAAPLIVTLGPYVAVGVAAAIYAIPIIGVNVAFGYGVYKIGEAIVNALKGPQPLKQLDAQGRAALAAQTRVAQLAAQPLIPLVPRTRVPEHPTREDGLTPEGVRPPHVPTRIPTIPPGWEPYIDPGDLNFCPSPKIDLKDEGRPSTGVSKIPGTPVELRPTEDELKRAAEIISNIINGAGEAAAADATPRVMEAVINYFRSHATEIPFIEEQRRTNFYHLKNRTAWQLRPPAPSYTPIDAVPYLDRTQTLQEHLKSTQQKRRKEIQRAYDAEDRRRRKEGLPPLEFQPPRELVVAPTIAPIIEELEPVAYSPLVPGYRVPGRLLGGVKKKLSKAERELAARLEIEVLEIPSHTLSTQELVALAQEDIPTLEEVRKLVTAPIEEQKEQEKIKRDKKWIAAQKELFKQQQVKKIKEEIAELKTTKEKKAYFTEKLGPERVEAMYDLFSQELAEESLENLIETAILEGKPIAGVAPLQGFLDFKLKEKERKERIKQEIEKKEEQLAGKKLLKKEAIKETQPILKEIQKKEEALKKTADKKVEKVKKAFLTRLYNTFSKQILEIAKLEKKLDKNLEKLAKAGKPTEEIKEAILVKQEKLKSISPETLGQEAEKLIQDRIKIREQRKEDTKRYFITKLKTIDKQIVKESIESRQSSLKKDIEDSGKIQEKLDRFDEKTILTKKEKKTYQSLLAEQERKENKIRNTQASLSKSVSKVKNLRAQRDLLNMAMQEKLKEFETPATIELDYQEFTGFEKHGQKILAGHYYKLREALEAEKTGVLHGGKLLIISKKASETLQKRKKEGIKVKIGKGIEVLEQVGFSTIDPNLDAYIEKTLQTKTYKEKQKKDQEEIIKAKAKKKDAHVQAEKKVIEDIVDSVKGLDDKAIKKAFKEYTKFLKKAASKKPGGGPPGPPGPPGPGDEPATIPEPSFKPKVKKGLIIGGLALSAGLVTTYVVSSIIKDALEAGTKPKPTPMPPQPPVPPFPPPPYPPEPPPKPPKPPKPPQPEPWPEDPEKPKPEPYIPPLRQQVTTFGFDTSAFVIDANDLIRRELHG